MTEMVCFQCKFELFLPIRSLLASDLGLYNDARFPGRCLLVLKEHYEHLDEVPDWLLARFTDEMALVSGAIRRATGCDRVNAAILGNAQPHVHAHLIPRWRAYETRPQKSPWDDPRPWKKMVPEAATGIIQVIRKELS